MESSGGRAETATQRRAQESADRLRLLRQALSTPELQQVLALTPD